MNMPSVTVTAYLIVPYQFTVYKFLTENDCSDIPCALSGHSPAHEGRFLFLTEVFIMYEKYQQQI